MTDQHVDIAIVGGGITGLYCCFHLARRYDRAHPAGTLALYESSNRLGGKIESWRIDPKTIDKEAAEPVKIRDLMDENRKLVERTGAPLKVLRDLFVAEFGPMRIEPDHQPYLKQLLHDVRITDEGEQQKWSDLVPFPAYRAEPPTEPRFTLEGEEAEQTSLIDLLLLALRRVCEVLRFDGADSEAPWVLRDPHNKDERPYDAANFFWQEFRREKFFAPKILETIAAPVDQSAERRSLRGYTRKGEVSRTIIAGYGVLEPAWRGTESYGDGEAARLGELLSFASRESGAADWLIFWLRAIKSTDALRGIRGGMDWIVHSLCQDEKSPLKFVIDPDKEETADRIYPIYRQGNEAGPKLFLTKKLIKVEEFDRDGKVCLRLTFRDMTDRGRISTIIADHAILALPKSALQEIEFESVDQTGEALKILFDAVGVIPLLKCFFIVKDPFWEDNRPASRYAHTAPTRELHYWKNRDHTRGMMMIYTDRPGTQFWCDYMVEGLKVNVGKQYGLPGGNFKTVRRDRPTAQIWNWVPVPHDFPVGHVEERFANDRLLRTFLAYSTEDGAEGVTGERLLAAGMHDWGLKPYEGAAHAWRPGSDPKRIMEYFRAFSLKGREDKRLHICGEAYSDYQGFMEGALRSAAEVLVYEFGVPRSKLTGQEDGAPRRLARAPAVSFE